LDATAGFSVHLATRWECAECRERSGVWGAQHRQFL